MSKSNSYLKRSRKWSIWLVIIAALLISVHLWPHAPLHSQITYSTAIYDKNQQLLRLTLASDDRYRLWVPLQDISPVLLKAVLLQEDQWFYRHPGFNLLSLIRGAWVTYVMSSHRQGGSTITMQLARLRWQLNTRTPYGKLYQILRAIQLELFYSKNDILEAYLNYAPYGRNIEGVGAASLIYFNKKASQLSLPEAITLAVVPQDPTRRVHAHTHVKSKTSSRALTQSRNRLFQRWVTKYPQDDAQRPIFSMPLILRQPEELPFEAPHLVEHILAKQRWQSKALEHITSTVDLGLQHIVEQQIWQYIMQHKTLGIRNATALLVDVRDMGVRALVGSANYFDETIAGQVNGVNAKRSPGSTLKPFIYALGMDQGVLHPYTVLRDVPTSFGPFAPENFDGHFLGPVTATDALIRSRNIPAVYVASQLADPSFYQFLRAAGISHMASEQHYGLALVLGAGEVTMQELAMLYAMLANHGMLQTLQFDVDAARSKGTQLLSEEASFMVLDMLRKNQRPDELTIAQSQRFPIYWKTGTSWGFRDAWTAGIFGPYVLIVWVGNFDGSGNPAFVGIDAAAPLFFKIIDSIQANVQNLTELPRIIPKHLKKVEVCLASGDLPNVWCQQRGFTWFIPGKSPIRVSNIHRPVVFDIRTDEVACPPYDPDFVRTEIYEFWPSDLAKVFEQAGIPRRPPPVNQNCPDLGVIIGQAPHITSPISHVAYALRIDEHENESIALEATVDANVRSIYWFLNNQYVGESQAGSALFWRPQHAGQYTVRVVDHYGRSDVREFKITLRE